MDIFSLDQEYVAGTYARFPVALVSGKGSILTDVNGKQYIDMGSGIGVTSFGIADETWLAAVTAAIHASSAKPKAVTPMPEPMST